MSTLRRLDRTPARKPGDTVRDGRLDTTEEDALQSRDDEPSRELLMSALEHTDKGSELERALVWALRQREKTREQTSPPPPSGDGGGGVTSRLLVQLAACVMAVLGFVQPTVATGAERLWSPTSALERKLDEVIAQQTEQREQDRQNQAIVTSLAKWIVNIEVERANAVGEKVPELPPIVRLLLAQDEIERTTGP